MKNTQTKYHIDVTPEEDKMFRDEPVKNSAIKALTKKLMPPKLNMTLAIVAGFHVCVVLAVFAFTTSSKASEQQNVATEIKKNDQEFLDKEVANTTPQPTPAISPTPAPSRNNKHYTTKYVVQTGDTVYSISRKYKLNVDRLIKINDIKDPNKITIGQTLKFM
jgi:LysM repeat protein